MANKIALYERRQRIRELLSQGKNYQEIKDILGIGISTIAKDCKMIKKELRESISEKEGGDWLIQLQENLQQSLKKLYVLMDETESEHTRLRCISEVNKLLIENIKLCQSIGLIEKAAEKIEIDSEQITAKDFAEFYRQTKEEEKVNVTENPKIKESTLGIRDEK